MKKTRIKGDFDTTIGDRYEGLTPGGTIIDDKPSPIPRPYDIGGIPHLGGEMISGWGSGV